MYQLIDFINPQGSIAFTDRIDKIQLNLKQVEPLKRNIEQQRLTNKNAISCITVIGRWIVIYQSNLTNDDDTIMHFIDCRIDIEPIANGNIFSEKTIQGIKTIKSEYDKVYNDNLDTVELTFAEPFEKILRPNLFFCDNNEIVLQKARQLGTFPIIETLKEGDRVKVTIVDEKVIVDNNRILNVYALIHFGGHSEERKDENGFAYVKIFDLLNNPQNIDDFQKAIEGAGGKFERAFFMEKFAIDRLN